MNLMPHGDQCLASTPAASRVFLELPGMNMLHCCAVHWPAFIYGQQLGNFSGWTRTFPMSSSENWEACGPSEISWPEVMASKVFLQQHCARTLQDILGVVCVVMASPLFPTRHLADALTKLAMPGGQQWEASANWSGTPGPWMPTEGLQSKAFPASSMLHLHRTGEPVEQ